MTRKLRRAIPLLLALVMLLSLSAFAADNRLPTYIDTLPSVSAVGIASKQLSTLELIGGRAVDQWGHTVIGKFVWDEPTSLMEAGIKDTSVTFQPIDTKNFAPCTFTVKVHAYKLNLTVKQLPKVEEKLAVGKTVAGLTLSGGTAVNHFEKCRPSVPGHFEFVDTQQKFEKAGTYECAVVFKPDNSDLYNDAVVTYTRNPDRTFRNAFVKVVVE